MTLRTLLASALAAAVLTLTPSNAQACDVECGAGCPLSKGKAAKADGTKASEPKSVMDAVDQAMAAKCSCSSAADCTCKKGECKCDKCGKKAKPVYESLNGATDSTVLPVNAKLDATAGIFI